MGWPFDEEDEEQQAELPQDQAAQPAAPAAPAVPSVKDYLLQKYKIAADDSGVRQAQADAKRAQLIAGLGQAAEGFARSRSQVYGGGGVNNSTYQGITQGAHQRVAQAQENRKNAVDQVLGEYQLGASVDKNEQDKKLGNMKLQEGGLDLKRKQQALDEGDIALQSKKLDFGNAKNLSDPASPESLAATEAYQKVGARTGVKIPQGLSAVQLSAMFGKDPLKELVTMRDIDAKIDGTKAVRDQTNTYKDIASKDREDKALNADFDSLTNGIQGSIKNSIGGEKTKLRNTTHAMAILDHYGNNLDNLTPEQVQEVGSAMAATLSQGHPAEALVHSMTPKSVGSDLSKALEYITGAPQSAGLGKQMLLYKQMLQRQADTSKDIIAGELGPIVANKAHLLKKDPERFNNIMREAGVAVDPRTTTITAYAPKYSPGRGDGPAKKGDGATAYASEGKAPPNAALHPQANAALDWAKANPQDPRARAILDRLGIGSTGDDHPDIPQQGGRRP